MKKFILFSLTFSTTLFSTDISQLETFNFLKKELNNHKIVSSDKKFDYSFLNKEEFINNKYPIKFQNDLIKIIELYYLKEFKSSLYLLNKLQLKKNDKYLKMFNILLNMNIKLEKNLDIKNEIFSLINFGEFDYFIISEVLNLLSFNNLFDLGIILTDKIVLINNNFINKFDVNNFSNNKKIINNYQNSKFLYKNIKNKEAYFYYKIGKLLEAYELYKNNNYYKVNNEIISKIRKEITFRIDIYNKNDYLLNKNKLVKEISFTKPFIVYDIKVEDK